MSITSAQELVTFFPEFSIFATGYVHQKGANQAVAAQRLSASPVRLVAAVGSDPFGMKAQAFVSEFGVSDANLIIMPDEATGIALIHVDAASQNTITVVGGANMAWPDQGPDAAVFSGALIAQLERFLSRAPRS
jgi:ribokinase